MFVGLSIRKLWRTSGLSISRLGDLDLWPLTFDLWPLTFKLVRVIAGGVGNLPSNLRVSGMFRSVFMGQHLSGGWSDLATLTFDIVACRWYRSSYSICVPSLKFTGLRFQKILYIYCVKGTVYTWLLLLLVLLVFSAQRQVLSHWRQVSLSCAFSFSFA